MDAIEAAVDNVVSTADDDDDGEAAMKDDDEPPPLVDEDADQHEEEVAVAMTAEGARTARAEDRRDECSRLGVSTSGNKTELLDRLLEACAPARALLG